MFWSAAACRRFRKRLPTLTGTRQTRKPTANCYSFLLSFSPPQLLTPKSPRCSTF